MRVLDYVIVFVLGSAVGAGELVARYRDEPGRVLRYAPSVLYVVVNGLGAVFALFLIATFDWRFGVPDDDPAQLELVRVLTASLGAAVLFRTSLLTAQQQGESIPIGPSALLEIIRRAIDRSIDRQRARERLEFEVGDVAFAEQHEALAQYCIRSMQSLAVEDVEWLGERAKALKDQTDLADRTKIDLFGLDLMTVVGERNVLAALDKLRVSAATSAPAVPPPPLGSTADASPSDTTTPEVAPSAEQPVDVVDEVVDEPGRSATEQDAATTTVERFFDYIADRPAPTRVDLLTRAIDLFPEFAEPRLARAFALQELARVRHQNQSATGLTPETISRLARWRDAREDADSVRDWLVTCATDDLDEALKAWPDLTAAYFQRATIGLEVGLTRYSTFVSVDRQDAADLQHVIEQGDAGALAASAHFNLGLVELRSFEKTSSPDPTSLDGALAHFTACTELERAATGRAPHDAARAKSVCHLRRDEFAEVVADLDAIGGHPAADLFGGAVDVGVVGEAALDPLEHAIKGYAHLRLGDYEASARNLLQANKIEWPVTAKTDAGKVAALLSKELALRVLTKPVSTNTRLLGSPSAAADVTA